VEKNSFHFESALKERTGQILFLQKPKVIHKNRIRDHARATFRLPIHFTLWTETGRFEGTILDMTEDGIRLETRKPMRKGTLISLDFYIKAEKIRVISQGLVAWCVQNKDNEYLFESGVQFTTMSNETKKKLARYCEKIAAPPAETDASSAAGVVSDAADAEGT
ncbi:MAG: PilZ domain-containing protein, partial [Spirochaetia bacterium]|nr:PilZ domain-containing protein [Spirochaetia bacterium]